MLGEWAETLDSGGCVDVLYCDFMKAFDTVQRKRLLHKFKLYNIGGCYSNWIEAFPSERKQTVRVNGKGSSGKWNS